MQCTCRENLEEKLLAKFKEDNPDSIDHRIELAGYSFVFGETLEERAVMTFNSSHVVTAKNGNKREKKDKHSLLCRYCPFCGKPAKADAEEKQA